HIPAEINHIRAVTNTKSMITGSRYLMMNTHVPNINPCFTSSASETLSRSTFHPRKSVASSAPSGMNMLDTSMSMVSNMDLEKICTSDSTLMERVLGTPNRKMSTAKIHVALFRFSWRPLMTLLTLISIIEMDEVSVAKRKS